VVPAPHPICGLTLLAWQLGELDATGLWREYSCLGGSATSFELELYLNGCTSWPATEHDVLTQALNEQLWDTDQASLAPLRGTALPTNG
jgi:hypothetical protein